MFWDSFLIEEGLTFSFYMLLHTFLHQMTFFDNHPATFNTCKIENDQVETAPFLAAAEVLAKLLGKFVYEKKDVNNGVFVVFMPLTQDNTRNG